MTSFESETESKSKIPEEAHQDQDNATNCSWCIGYLPAESIVDSWRGGGGTVSMSKEDVTKMEDSGQSESEREVLEESSTVLESIDQMVEDTDAATASSLPQLPEVTKLFEEEQPQSLESGSSTIESQGEPDASINRQDINGNLRTCTSIRQPKKMTDNEFVKWMNHEEHYLEPSKLSESFVENNLTGGDAETEVDDDDPVSSTFQVTVQSLGNTIDLAGGCKTPSSTGTPPPPPESLPETITSKQVVSAVSVPTVKSQQPVKQTNGTGTPKNATTKSTAGAGTPNKTASSGAVNKKPSPTTVAASTTVKAATSGSPARTSRRASAPQTPTTPNEDANKKVPMNKVKVGTAPSPNIKEVKAKIGSLSSVTGAAAPPPRKPAASSVKIPEQKLAWKAESKVGSFNTTYVRKGGSVKVKVEPKKVEVKEVTSKVGSWNVAYKPGGGEKKIFDDKEYLKKTHSNSSSEHGASAPVTPRPPSSATNGNEALPPVAASTAEDSNSHTKAAEPKLIDA